MRRGHGMACQALAQGGIDEEALRDLLVAVRRRWPLAFAIDASAYPGPEGADQPGPAMASSFLPGQSRRRRAAVAGWAFQ